MLISQFDKFVNRSTQEILGSEIERENLEPMLSTDIVRNGGNVTGVKGENEVYYRTGNVNLTSADIGALDENKVYNDLDQTEPGYALDARKGKVLNDAIGDKLDKAKVYNGLDQTEPGYALDARQGKALADQLTKQSFSLTPPSGWTMAYNNCYVYGKLVFISGMFSNTTTQSAKQFNMGDCIPNEYTSPYRFGFIGFNNTTDNPLHGIVNGRTIIFYRPQTENLTAIEFSATYII